MLHLYWFKYLNHSCYEVNKITGHPTAAPSVIRDKVFNEDKPILLILKIISLMI